MSLTFSRSLTIRFNQISGSPKLAAKTCLVTFYCKCCFPPYLWEQPIGSKEIIITVWVTVIVSYRKAHSTNLLIAGIWLPFQFSPPTPHLFFNRQMSLESPIAYFIFLSVALACYVFSEFLTERVTCSGSFNSS